MTLERIDIILPRHAVPSDPATGLSELQAAMIDDPSPVRIFSAPTGAGKSFAFQKAMREHGQRILFIVPTRRLAQNIAQGLIGDLIDTGWNADQATRQVAVWTSEERARLMSESPDLDIRRHRLSQLRNDGGANREGMMIVATQESVVHLLLGRGPDNDGTDPKSIFDLLRLDHVVFDEFHTIDVRGMGLACAIAGITSQIVGGCKVTFLSATPIDIKPTLVGFGLDPANISVRQERVVTGEAKETLGMRAIHGDVRLRLIEGDGIPETLEYLEADIRATLARQDEGHQIVLIYDSLKRLLADKARLAALFDQLGVSREERLAINSADDSVALATDAHFTFGHRNDPKRFRVLVATSSVEMGVTFKAGLIVMEPGHDPCSFVQRLGRVARGDLPGQVIVLIKRDQMDRLGWMRSLIVDLSVAGDRISIDRFLDLVLRSARARFDVSGIDLEAEDGNFRRMPQAAIWCAALFWCAMERVEWRTKLAKNYGLFRPKKASRMSFLLDNLLCSPNRHAQEFGKRLIKEAKVLRIIGEKVRLVEEGGASKDIPWTLYASTRELLDYPSIQDEKGLLRVMVPDAISAIEARLGGLQCRREEEALLPHCGFTKMIEADRMREVWLRYIDKEKNRPGLLRVDLEAIEAASTIVRLTGIVPIERTVAGE